MAAYGSNHHQLLHDGQGGECNDHHRNKSNNTAPWPWQVGQVAKSKYHEYKRT